MELSLKDEEIDGLAWQVARLTGETVPEAVRGALRERPWNDAAIQATVDCCAARPLLDTRSDDEILGYTDNGLPC